MASPTWDDPDVLWDDPEWTWDGLPLTGGVGGGGVSITEPEAVWVHSLPAMSAADQAIYHATSRSSHVVGAWVQILDENEHPLWEMSSITDGGVSFDVSQTPDRTLDVTVLDLRKRLLRGAPTEEAAEAHRFVRFIYEKLTTAGWMRFPLFTGPLSSGGLQREGAEVVIRASGKESLFMEPWVVWQAQHYPAHTKVVDAIRAIAAAQGETHFRLPNLDEKLAHRVVIKRFSEAWPVIQHLANRIRHIAYFDGEGYLGLRPRYSKGVDYVFDPEVVIGTPQVDDDYALINTAETEGPDPKGTAKPIHQVAELAPDNPFSSHGMSRHGVPRRAIAHDQSNLKTKAALADHARSMLRVPSKKVSLDCLPIPHIRPGMIGRCNGEYEGTSIDAEFPIDSGFYPAIANTPMTIGAWKPINANWKRLHMRASYR